MTVDREVLRVRLLDVLATFGPRRSWDGPGGQRRVDYWLDRLMEADRPDDGSEKSVAVFEVERLRRRVVELEVAYDLQREAIEAERSELRARLEATRRVVAELPVAFVADAAAILDTPSTPVVDSE